MYRAYCKKCGCVESAKRAKTVDGVVSRIYSSQKSASIRRGYVLPDYSKNQLKKWLLGQSKFYSLYVSWTDSGHDKSLSVSCDRLDDYKPYTLQNIQLMTWGENNEKGNADIRNGINNKQAKSVVQLSLCGETLNTFYSAHQAARETGLNRGHISSCCRGNTNLKTHGGFKWEYLAF